MKGINVKRLQIALYILLGVVALACFLAAVGCASTTDQTFDAAHERLVPFVIPEPPPDRECTTPAALQHRSLPLEEVEADGSVMLQALTADVLTLLEQVWKNYHECEASNEARQAVIEKAEEARKRLEELNSDGQ